MMTNNKLRVVVFWISAMAFLSCENTVFVRAGGEESIANTNPQRNNQEEKEEQCQEYATFEKYLLLDIVNVPTTPKDWNSLEMSILAYNTLVTCTQDQQQQQQQQQPSTSKLSFHQWNGAILKIDSLRRVSLEDIPGKMESLVALQQQQQQQHQQDEDSSKQQQQQPQPVAFAIRGKHSMLDEDLQLFRSAMDITLAASSSSSSSSASTISAGSSCHCKGPIQKEYLDLINTVYGQASGSTTTRIRNIRVLDIQDEEEAEAEEQGEESSPSAEKNPPIEDDNDDDKCNDILASHPLNYFHSTVRLSVPADAYFEQGTNGEALGQLFMDSYNHANLFGTTNDDHAAQNPNDEDVCDPYARQIQHVVWMEEETHSHTRQLGSDQNEESQQSPSSAPSVYIPYIPLIDIIFYISGSCIGCESDEDLFDQVSDDTDPNRQFLTPTSANQDGQDESFKPPRLRHHRGVGRPAAFGTKTANLDKNADPNTNLSNCVCPANSNEQHQELSSPTSQQVLTMMNEKAPSVLGYRIYDLVEVQPFPCSKHIETSLETVILKWKSLQQDESKGDFLQELGHVEDLLVKSYNDLTKEYCDPTVTMVDKASIAKIANDGLIFVHVQGECHGDCNDSIFSSTVGQGSTQQEGFQPFHFESFKSNDEDHSTCYCPVHPKGYRSPTFEEFMVHFRDMLKRPAS